jgi:hypothetical protein
VIDGIQDTDLYLQKSISPFISHIVLEVSGMVEEGDGDEQGYVKLSTSGHVTMTLCTGSLKPLFRSAPG